METIDVILNVGTKEAPRVTESLSMASPSPTSAAARSNRQPTQEVLTKPASDGLPVRGDLRTQSRDDSLLGASDARSSAPADVYACLDTKHSYVAKKNTFMAAHYAATKVKRVKVKATMIRETSSRIGIGASVTGKGLSFSRGGEMSLDRSVTTGFTPSFTASYHHYSYVNYYKYRRHCYNDTGYSKITWRVKPTQIIGGAAYRKVSIPSAKKCLTYSRGSDITKDSARAWMSYNGADLSGLIGVDLSAETGYRKTARISYNALSTMAWRGCGTNAYPEQAQRVVVRDP